MSEHAHTDREGGGERAEDLIVAASPELNLPRPTFEVLGARVPRFAIAPNLIFDVELNDASGFEIFTIALAVQIAIEPAQRRYDEATRERLTELLGEPGRIGSPTRTMSWAKVDVLVQSFTGMARVEVPVLCNYDLEIAATNYFHSLPGGEVPLVFHFNGGVYYRDEDGQLQIIQLNWEESTNYRMPVEVWEELVAAHYPNREWLAAGSETIERLRRFKLEEGLPSFEAALERLLDR